MGMKRQVVIVHGGEAYTDYTMFLSQLREREVDYDTFFTQKGPGWKDLLQSRLGDGYEVAVPRMPNRANAQFEEWKLWFERLLPFLRDDIILIGHSLGAMFLAKYLSENVLPVRIHKVFLVAPAISGEGLEGEDGGDFFPDEEKLGLLTEQSKSVYVFHSKDDPVCPYSHSEKYVQLMPEAVLVSFEDREHFSQEDIPELVERIVGE